MISELELWLIITISLVVVALSGLVIHYSMTPCPSCERRGSLWWLHQKKGGGPDRRYKANYQLCRSCGWTELDELLADVEAREQKRHRHPARGVTGEAASEARLLEAEQVERSVIWVLKYLARAEHRLAEGEKQRLFDVVEKLIPVKRQLDLWARADPLGVDSLPELEKNIAVLADLSKTERRQYYGMMETMAAMDGEATESEEARLKIIRERMGLA